MKDRVSTLLHKIPEDLELCAAPASSDELETFLGVRRRYADDVEKALPEHDKVRAFRLLKGMSRYLEVGTFDKFNLCYVSGLLSPSATMIDLDIAENPPAERRLREDLAPGQTYHSIVGDSMKEETRDKVLELAGKDPFDAVFIDANHMARYAMNDFALYGELVSADGYVFFHDVKFEGGEKGKGVSQALEVLQRFVPIYEVISDDPVTHWFPPLSQRKVFWGGVAIMRGCDFHKALA